MPAYGFKSQFVAKILAGTKPHTIRAIRKDERVPRVGEPFIGYTGMRQPQCCWLFSSTTTKVEPIQIGPERFDMDRFPEVRLNGTPLAQGTVRPYIALIRADGFEDESQFIEHFVPQTGDVFHGYLIHWNPEDAIAARHPCPLCKEEQAWSEARRVFFCRDNVCPHSATTAGFRRPTK